MNRVVAITGPTAIGKSALADRLARRLDAPVISADSMQVYRGMNIGTAKTPVSERLVPLLLVDVADPREPYSAARYQRDARIEINRLLALGKVPILCGGTGLYLRAALDDMRFPKGVVDDDRRRAYQSILEAEGPQALYEMLKQRDPASAQVVHPHNVKRVIRALEMHDEGVSYADQAAGFSTPVPVYDHVTFALTMDRARLYQRIDDRVDIMMEQGLLDEVRGLLDAGLREALTSMQAIGYKELIDYFDGALSLDEAVALIKQRSRRYAKRQLAWCRHDARTQWIDMDSMTIDDAVEHVLSYLERP